MAHDPRVAEQPSHVVLGEVRHDPEVEPGEGGTEGLTLAQDGQPAQPGLEPLFSTSA